MRQVLELYLDSVATHREARLDARSWHGDGYELAVRGPRSASEARFAKAEASQDGRFARVRVVESINGHTRGRGFAVVRVVREHPRERRRTPHHACTAKPAMATMGPGQRSTKKTSKGAFCKISRSLRRARRGNRVKVARCPGDRCGTPYNSQRRAVTTCFRPQHRYH